MQRVYNILSGFLGESKQGHYMRGCSQYQFCCPSCAEKEGGVSDGKYNLEISFSLGKYHCWKCDIKGPISALIRRYGGYAAYEEYLSIIKDIKESGYYDLSSFGDSGVSDIENELRLPETYKKVDIYSPKKVLSYLQKRGIGEDIIKEYNIGYTTWDEKKWQYRNRIIIPSYDGLGNLTYWCGRDYSGYEKAVKYINCNADKQSIVFNEGLVQWDADIFLCEGIIDSITYHNAIPLMGKVLSKESLLYRKLFSMANANITICLDSDTTLDETKRIYSLLDRGKLRGKIWYIRLGEKDIPFKDFGEIYEAQGKKGMIDVMRKQRQFKEYELVF